MKIEITETKKREFEVEFPCYRKQYLYKDTVYAVYKVTEKHDQLFIETIKTCSFPLEYGVTCKENAFGVDTGGATEQEWAEALVKLSVQTQHQLKEYSI